MNSNRGLLISILLALGFIVAINSFYVVNETEKAVLKQFGRIEKTDIQPGFYGKLPLFQQVVKVDGRTLVYDVPAEAITTAEKKLLNVDFFVIWRIKDVQQYVTSLGRGSTNSRYIQNEAEQRLGSRVIQALRDEFGKRDVQEVVADEREEVMDQVAAEVNKGTVKDLGLEIIDIRVKQVDWPEQVRDRVYDRMRAERARDAAEHRAQGREESEKIRASADRQRTVLIAEAYRDAQRLRGEGDASAAAIYAKAFNRDKEFYRFYRSLEAYRNSFSQPEDVLVLEPDSDFFRYMMNSKAK